MTDRRSLLANLVAVVGISIGAATLGACGASVEHNYPYQDASGRNDPSGRSANAPTVFGDGGLKLFGGSSRSTEGEDGGGVGVNSFLWRASLDSIAFMPLASADPFGGVIITDWYAPPETPDERFKVNVYILGRELRADGLKAAVFRQTRDGVGTWSDAPVESKTATDLENAILTRARQIRMAQASR